MVVTIAAKPIQNKTKTETPKRNIECQQFVLVHPSRMLTQLTSSIPLHLGLVLHLEGCGWSRELVSGHSSWDLTGA